MSRLLAAGAVGDIICVVLGCGLLDTLYVEVCAYAVDPFWVEEGLVDEGGAIVPLAFHVKIFGSGHVSRIHITGLIVRTLAEGWFLQRRLLCDGLLPPDKLGQPCLHRK